MCARHGRRRASICRHTAGSVAMEESVIMLDLVLRLGAAIDFRGRQDDLDGGV